MISMLFACHSTSECRPEIFRKFPVKNCHKFSLCQIKEIIKSPWAINIFFAITTRWTGNSGQGTSAYRSYERSVTISVKNKADILGSSGTAFNSDKSKHNPEDLFVSAISSCHLLWYLHLCSENGVVVLDYVDDATGTMEETADGGGKFTEVTLHPTITLSSPSMIQKSY
jgi:organic hydroperoxide reductase OsmC/OhrA